MANRVLGGVRVLDFCWVWAGPSGTELLSLMGAEVIKVETWNRIDQARTQSFRPRQQITDPELNPTFSTLNLNKLGITVNLAKPEGIELIKRLVGISDVVTDNFSGGTMERFGLTYPELKKVKPDIITLSASGFGATGPDRKYVGYAPVFASLSGITYATGYPDGPPATSGAGGWVDIAVGMSLAFAVLVALNHRARTGEGQNIDLCQWEVTNCLAGDILMDYAMNGRNRPRMGNQDELMAPHNCYPCRGGDKWVSIAISTEEEWSAFCQAIGNPDWTKKERFSDAYSRWQNQQEMDRLIGEWTQKYTHYEVMEILQRAGVAAFPSFNHEELINNIHLKERGCFVDVEHPAAGKQTVLGSPWKLSATPAEVTSPAPLMGEHNEYVFCQLLGLPTEEFARLVADEVIY